jgi:plastocyanin
MHRSLTLAAAAAVVAMTLTGCDGTGEPATTDAPAEAENRTEEPRGNGGDYGAGGQPAPNGQKSAGEPGKISVVGNAFGPQVVTVSAGDTVTFTNQDGIAHTATANGVFDRKLPAGETREWTAKQPGEYSYLCTLHPTMTGTITVQ